MMSFTTETFRCPEIDLPFLMGSDDSRILIVQAAATTNNKGKRWPCNHLAIHLGKNIMYIKSNVCGYSRQSQLYCRSLQIECMYTECKRISGSGTYEIHCPPSIESPSQCVCFAPQLVKIYIDLNKSLWDWELKRSHLSDVLQPNSERSDNIKPICRCYVFCEIW